MTSKRKTSVTLFKGGNRESRSLPLWRESFHRWQDARPVLNKLDALWAIVENHRTKSMRKLSGEAEDWESRLGLHSHMKRTKDNLRMAHSVRDAAIELLEQAAEERAGLHPFSGTSESPAEAITRASIRQALLGMAPEQRTEFLKQPMDERTRRAIFEVSPEFVGLKRDAAVYQRLYDQAMKELHGERLERLDDLAALADYGLKLSAAVEEIVQVDALDSGVKPSEVRDFIQKATAAA